MPITIATWNVNSIKVRLPQVLQWLQENSIDVLALQETKTIDEKFPHTEFSDLGYHLRYSGQKTYNGVAIISKLPLTDIAVEFPGFVDPMRRVLGATLGNNIRLLNLYVPNGAAVDSDKYIYKLNWLAQLHAYVIDQLKQYPQLVVVGDFNIAPEDRDVHDPKAWEGQVLVSEKERQAFAELINLGLQDTFRLFPEQEQAPRFSWWDYRAGAFRRDHGLRIDHILASHELAKTCLSCRVDKEPRAHEQPSDHAPVVAAFK